MKRLLLAYLLLSCVALCSVGRENKQKAGDPPPDRVRLTKLVNYLMKSRAADGKAVLKELDSGCASALEQGNVQVIRLIEADEYTFTGPDGSILTKAQDLETITSGDLVYDKIDLDDVKVRLFGETGIVTGRANVKGRYKTFDISGAYRYTATFIRLQGRWQAVASQMTRVMG